MFDVYGVLTVNNLSKGILDIDGNDLPIGGLVLGNDQLNDLHGACRITCVDHGKGSKDLSLLHLASLSRRQGANVEDVDGVVITGEASEIVDVCRVLPSLRDGTIVEWVGLVRPDAVDEANFVVLVIVEDGVCQTTTGVSLSSFNDGCHEC